MNRLLTVATWLTISTIGVLSYVVYFTRNTFGR